MREGRDGAQELIFAEKPQLNNKAYVYKTT